MRTIEQILNYLFLIIVGLYAVIMLADTVSVILTRSLIGQLMALPKAI